MSDTSAIEWTDATWNPVRGCSMVSDGCTNCYAMAQAHRFAGAGQPYDGLTKATSHGPVWTGQVRTSMDMLLRPTSWRKPRHIFVNSMSDLFHKAVPDQFISDVFGIMAVAHWHTFQVLTKRQERMRVLLSSEAFVDQVDNCAAMYSHHDVTWPLPNVWLGVSVEHQAAADERIPLLLQTPAAKRWISAEPMLGPVDLLQLRDRSEEPQGGALLFPLAGEYICDGMNEPRPIKGGGINWVVVGGESGPKARPFELAWARDLVSQCKAADVPCFVKQLGRYPVPESDDLHGRRVKGHGFYQRWPQRYCDENERISVDLKDRAGGDPAEWPEDLRVREYPAT